MAKFGLLSTLAAFVVAGVLVAGASAGPGVSGVATVNPLVLNDSSLKALTTTVGGATVLPTTRTVAHWHGTSLNPSDGVTYGYNMVGADPNNCSGSACSTTIQADITPLIVNVDGLTFDGTSVVRRHAGFAAVREQRLRRRRPSRRRRIRTFPLHAGQVACSRRAMPGCSCSSRMRPCARSSTRPAPQLPRDPAPARAAGGDDQRAEEPGHA